MPLIKLNMRSGALALVPQQEVQSKNSVQDVAPYIRTSGERERGKKYLIIATLILKEDSR